LSKRQEDAPGHTVFRASGAFGLDLQRSKSGVGGLMIPFC
jgi:hypothetical protein